MISKTSTKNTSMPALDRGRLSKSKSPIQLVENYGNEAFDGNESIDAADIRVDNTELMSRFKTINRGKERESGARSSILPSIANRNRDASYSEIDGKK